MTKIRPSTFLIGLIIAALTALIVWYYQKSTSAEDGALDLLDRYAQAQARLSELEGQLSNQT
jgi:hypothetical protein